MRRWSTDERELRQLLGIQLQETQLAEKLTVRETVRLFRSFYRRGREADDVIALVQLEEKARARVGSLSGGKKQRLALGCAGARTMVAPPMNPMPTEPLLPEDVDALLAPNVRTTVADLLSARDSLLRARAAFERLAVAVEHLREASLRAQNAARALDAEVTRHTRPPRAD